LCKRIFTFIKMKRFPIITLSAILFSSCATLFNNSTQRIVIDKDNRIKSISLDSSQKHIRSGNDFYVLRNRKPIKVRVKLDSTEQVVFLKSHNSFAFWINLYYNAGLGWLIDWNKPERYSYRKLYYLEMKDSIVRVRRFSPKQYIFKKNQVKISPLKVISNNRAIELSYEKQYARKFSLQFTSALLTDVFKNTPFAGLDDYSGFALGLENKYFIREFPDHRRYVSAEFAYVNFRFRDIKVFGYENPQDSLSLAYNYLDTFVVKKQTFSFNIRYGKQFVTNHFVADFSFGLGIRYRDVRHSERLVPEDFLQAPRYPNVFYIQELEGKDFVPSVSLNLKLGYVF